MTRKYIQHQRKRYFSNITDTQEENKEGIVEVPVVCELPGTFPEDLPGVTLERQAEFRIDLIPSVIPVAKEPYRLEPPVMRELYN